MGYKVKMKHGITKKHARIINVILTAAYTVMALWVDWRIAVIIFLYDISVVFDVLSFSNDKPELMKETGKEKKYG